VIVRAFRAKLKIKAEMIAHNGEKKEILLVVNVVNVGLRPTFVNHVRVILKPQELSVVGNPAIKMKADISELTAFQKNPIVEIKPHGGSHTWQMPFPTKPDFQVTEQNGEPYGNGYVELTSEDKKKFTFTILPDETWNIAPVFGGQVGHRCSRCDFMFLMKADAMSVVCPKCKNEDVLKPKQPAQSSFPAPADLSRMASKGNRFMGFGPEEIILSKLTFHVLRAYNRIYPKGALGVMGLVGYCQISEVDALASVQELWNMKYIRTVIDMPGEWNSEYAITDIGRDYVRRHAK
jgi:DNA-directed RNA polymerase subunit RPC12/RpoP